VILEAQQPSGAYPACESFFAYRGFCWFRDGSFSADAMSAIGEVESAEAFFDWCARVVLDRRSRIEAIVAAARVGDPLPDSQMLPTRFRFDGSSVEDGWENFQLDGYGTWVWAATAHARRHHRSIDRWAGALRLTVDYLVSSWRRPCFDWWEEHTEAVHVSTLGCVQAGLASAALSGVLDEVRRKSAQTVVRSIEDLIAAQGLAPEEPAHLTKWIGSTVVDGSLSALIAPLGVVRPGSEVARGTVAAIESCLMAEGGVYRFRADTFFGGGRWPLLTCFLGLARLAQGDQKGAVETLNWAVRQAKENGDVPEQVDGGLLLAPDRRDAWVDRWGDVACPLLWSHAMILRLGQELDAVGPALGIERGLS
jgi:GH15 family glucan-1,4-alpha-glucosidase